MTATNKPPAARKTRTAAKQSKPPQLPQRLGRPEVPAALRAQAAQAAAAGNGNGHGPAPVPDAKFTIGSPLALTTTAPVEAPKYATLFTIDGTEHKILTNPSAALALRYLDLMSSRGVDAAFIFAMEAMIGRPAYDALLAYEPLTKEQFKFVGNTVTETLLGALEDPKDA